MKLRPGQVQFFHLLIRNRNACRVDILIEFRLDGQARGGRRVADSLHDHFMIDERSPTPVFGNMTKHPMFNFVPFAGARREVADMDTESRLIREALQFDFPAPTTARIAPPTVRGNESLAGLGIQRLSHVHPPTPDGRHGTLGRVMVNPNAHPARIRRHIIHAIGTDFP